MHDIWNPWHGCTRVSEGCDNCYMYYMDGQRGIDPSVISKSKSGFTYPLQRRRDGSYKVRAGELIRICMTSDFLLPEADPWRPEVWDIIRQRPDVKFFILTKRPERFSECLPGDWGDGWQNVMLNVTCENQRRADERIPLLLATPAAHRGIMCAPFIGSVSVEKAAPAALESPMGSSRSSQAEKTTREHAPAITNGCASCMPNAWRQMQRSLSSKPEAPSLRTGKPITFVAKICKASRHGNQASSTAAAKSNGT